MQYLVELHSATDRKQLRHIVWPIVLDKSVNFCYPGLGCYPEIRAEAVGGDMKCFKLNFVGATWAGRVNVVAVKT